MKSRDPSCFIIAPPHVDTTTIRSTLAELGVLVNDAYGLSASESITRSIHSLIRKATFVVAVVDLNNPNSYYEVGFAAGRGKPIFLIAAPGTAIPASLIDRHHYRGDPEDKLILREALIRFTKAQLEGSQSSRVLSKKRIGSKKRKAIVGSRLDEVEGLRGSSSPKQVEDFVASLLKDLNVPFAAQEAPNWDRGADFAIWQNELARKTGGPILIEVKSGNLSEPMLRRAQDQLRDYLSKSDASAGLLLYLDDQARRFSLRGSTDGKLIQMDLADFIRDLESMSLAEAFLRARNRIVHGVER